VKITINDTLEFKIIANEYRAWANEKASIRKGYIGFSIKPDEPLKAHDTIKLYADNGELLDTYTI